MLKKWMLITGCASGILFASQLPQVLAQGRTHGRNSAGRNSAPRRDDAKRQLGALWNGVWRIEGSLTPLSKAQAKRLVATVRPWSSKSSMTQAQAKTLVSNLNGVLTAAQKSVVGNLDQGPGRPPRGMDGPPPDGPPPPREGRGDGPPQRNETVRKMMATLNPFYAPTGYGIFKNLPQRMQTDLLHRYQESRATLISLSRKAG